VNDRSPAAAVDFLRRSLTDGGLAVPELEVKAREAGLLGEHQLIQYSKKFKTAKKLLGIRSVRWGFGKTGAWTWRLPPQPSCPSANAPTPPQAAVHLEEAANPTVNTVNPPPPQHAKVHIKEALGPALDIRRRRIPQEWVDGIASLYHHRAPKDVPLHRWRVFVDDCQRFLLAKDNWAERAAMLDWDAHALFGCRTIRPLEHLASAGLLWAIYGGKLVELHRDWAVVERAADRSNQVHHRRCGRPANVTLPWTAKGFPPTGVGNRFHR
jgi:hypothetical protein